MWLLRIELRSSGRTVSALNPCAISPAPKSMLLKVVTILHASSVAHFCSTEPMPSPLKQPKEQMDGLLSQTANRGQAPGSLGHNGHFSLKPGSGSQSLCGSQSETTTQTNHHTSERSSPEGTKYSCNCSIKQLILNHN